MEPALTESLKQYFSTKPVLKAYIFGPVAKGEENENSDILVDLDYSKWIGLLFIQMKIDLEIVLHKKVDLVSTKGLSPYLKPQIDDEKLLIYERWKVQIETHIPYPTWKRQPS